MSDEARALKEAGEHKQLLRRRPRCAAAAATTNAVQTGKLGVDLSIQTNNLRNQNRLEQTAQQRVGNRNCIEIGGVWIDDGFDAKMPHRRRQGDERRLLPDPGDSIRR